MRDSDPRPMPPTVKAAYRNPIDLLGLLESEAYSDSDRTQVRDDLLVAITGDMGVVHLPHGTKQTRTATQRARAIKDPVRSIGFILSVEDYGGKERMLPYLARSMEPHWQSWWRSVNWDSWQSIHSWQDAARRVLGKRQLAWIASQYARHVVDMAVEREIALRAIEMAEHWCVIATEENMDRAEAAASAAKYAARNNTKGAAKFATYATSRAIDEAYAAAADDATYAIADKEEPIEDDDDEEDVAAFRAAQSAAYSRLCKLTKQLITPSLLEAR